MTEMPGADLGEKKRCCCLGVLGCARLVGGVLLILKLGLYAGYLVLIEDIRDLVLDDLYGISPCTVPPIDTITDVAFEYSILSNLLLLFTFALCTRWLLLPWLILTFLDILLLLFLGLVILVVPVHQEKLTMLMGINFQVYRFLGFLPIILAIFLLSLWFVIRSIYIELGKSSDTSKDPCCPLRLKTGVQIMGGALAILSGVILVLFFAKLDELIARKYRQLFNSEISRSSLTFMAGLIVLAIMVNILVILGGSGGRWRRALLLPWLLLYGGGTICSLAAHLYFTSLCWREEKLIGSLCLVAAFLCLVMWSMVWMVAAQVSGKTRTFIGGPSPLSFQRL